MARFGSDYVGCCHVLPRAHSFLSRFVLINCVYSYFHLAEWTKDYISPFIARSVWISKSLSPLNGCIQFAGTSFTSVFPSAYCSSMVLDSVPFEVRFSMSTKWGSRWTFLCTLIYLFGDYYFTVNLHAHPHQVSTPDHNFSSQYFSEHSGGEMVVGAALDRQTSLREDKTDFFSANEHVEEKGFVPFLSPAVSEGNWVTKKLNVAKDILLGMWKSMKSEKLGGWLPIKHKMHISIKYTTDKIHSKYKNTHHNNTLFLRKVYIAHNNSHSY